MEAVAEQQGKLLARDRELESQRRVQLHAVNGVEEAVRFGQGVPNRRKPVFPQDFAGRVAQTGGGDAVLDDQALVDVRNQLVLDQPVPQGRIDAGARVDELDAIAGENRLTGGDHVRIAHGRDACDVVLVVVLTHQA